MSTQYTGRKSETQLRLEIMSLQARLLRQQETISKLQSEIKSKSIKTTILTGEVLYM